MRVSDLRNAPDGCNKLVLTDAQRNRIRGGRGNGAKCGSVGMTNHVPTTRPDLTEYRVYIDVLLDKLNEDSVYKMSIEDLMKLLIEKAMKNYCPDVVVVPNRKRYEAWRF